MMKSCKISPYVIPAIRQDYSLLFEIPYNSERLSLEYLVTVVCDVFQVTKEQLYSTSRKTNIIYAKYCLRWFSAKYIRLKPSRMRYEFHIDYETIARSHVLVAALCETDTEFLEKFQSVKSRLNRHLNTNKLIANL